MSLKKIYLLFLTIILVACSNTKPVIDTSITIESTAVDMSGYRNVSSTNHQFREVNLYDVYDFIEKGGSGIFYLGYTGCHNCHDAVQYINEAAKELDVIVYYINIDRDEYHVKDNSAVYDEVIEKLGPVLDTDKSTGEKGIFTPDVFQVINGQFGQYHVGLVNNEDLDNENTINKLINIYKELMRPFSQK